MKKLFSAPAIFYRTRIAMCLLLTTMTATSNQAYIRADVPTAPSLLLLDGASLQRVRASLQVGESTYLPALAKLKEDANEALKAEPYSVTTKSQIPPSGDKHDYMSMSPYSWPDPTKPDGLPYISKDGQINPEVNKVTDKNYMQLMSTQAQTLALAYYFIGDERFAAHASKLLKTWFLDEATRMNPHLNYAQGVRGLTEGRGIGIIDTERLLSIPDTVTLLFGSKSWTSKDTDGMQKWFDEYLTWLRESKNGQDEAVRRNNHGTIYDTQVATYALFVEKPDVARKTLERSAQLRIANEIEADGRQPLELRRTKAWAYSAKNLGGLIMLATVGQHVGIDLWKFRSPDGRSIKSALDWMLSVSNGKTPWTFQEISQPEDWKPKVPPHILRRAERVWPDTAYTSALDAEAADESNRLNLLSPRSK